MMRSIRSGNPDLTHASRVDGLFEQYASSVRTSWATHVDLASENWPGAETAPPISESMSLCKFALP